MKENYALLLEELLAKPETRGKTLVLHSCCAPCSSYVLEYLRNYFRITVFYYNPNISQTEEYQKRLAEQKRLIDIFNEAPFPIQIVEGEHDSQCFFQAVKGLEDCKEGGERCFACFELRLKRTAQLAAMLKADYFTTTLTISPLKNAEKINEIGQRIAREQKVLFLPSDFKKRDGYKRSLELSREYSLYRQDYCGCVFSKREREAQRLAKSGV